VRPVRATKRATRLRGRALKGSRVVIVGRLQQRTWTAEDGAAHSVVEVVVEELGPSLRWATATTTRATRSQDQ
jgi:single-strand DNA-binding protein